MDFQLGHDPRTVRFGGLRADAQRGRDFFVGLALREQLQDFAFA